MLTSSVPSCHFVSLLGNVEFEAVRSISYFGGRGGHVCIVEVRLEIQIFQNWFTVIPNRSEVRGLGDVYRSSSDE